MDIRLINRSATLSGPQGTKEVPILTMMISGRLVNESSTETIIAIDLLQNFLQNTLKQSELANLFLIRKNGELISHANDSVLLQFSGKTFDHPIVKRLSTTNLPREAFEIEIGSEPFLANLSASGIGDVYVVSQVKKSDAFKALSTLAWQSLQIGLIIISLSLIASVIFSSKLTENIKKLEAAARDIGAGNLNVKVNIKSGDEVERVATTFEWMTGKITSLLKETAEKARMEEELATASLIQNTILTPPKLNIEATEVVPYYKSASECGGDLWDAFVANNKLTVLLGDATGHGAPAAIVTAVVKSCVATLNRFSKTEDLTPSQILNRVNEIVYQSCKGELLMTMCVAQLDLSNGELSIANAGHEAPLLVKSAQFSPENSEGKKVKADALFARGERLGFGAQSEYQSLTVQLEPGDTVLVYSDGVSEAHNDTGAMWGERNLKKTLASVGNMSLEKIKTSLIQAVETFTQGTPQKDDITFVLFGWKKSKSQSNPLETSQAA
ncbi:HAMP domain-containing protein [bacterium]|nr:HAMP domain-containing protein [bacterium]